MGERPSTSALPAVGVVADLRQRLWVGRERRATVAMLVAAASAYAFWPTLAALYSKWLNDPQYSHGLLVAPFAIGLLWAKRDRFPADVRPAPLPGCSKSTSRYRLIFPPGRFPCLLHFPGRERNPV